MAGKKYKSTEDSEATPKKKNEQYGVSSYGKSAKKTLKEIESVDPNTEEREREMSPMDRVESMLDRANDAAKGVTERIRNIFAD